jgi:mannose-1-phosphate guanylyltransferase
VETEATGRAGSGGRLENQALRLIEFGYRAVKAFLLAAGHGTRLRPLTDHTPKCLLPVRSVPILKIWLELCRLHAIDEVLINLHAHAHAVSDYLVRHENGVRIRIMEEPQLLGSAGTVWANRDWVNDAESFWIFYADVLTRADLTSMSRFHQRRGLPATLGVNRVPDPTRCGVVTAGHDSTLLSFVEKPKKPRSTLAFSGIMLATPRLLNFIPADRPADFGFHVLPRLAGNAAVYEISEYLIDIGTKETYETAQKTWPGL